MNQRAVSATVGMPRVPRLPFGEVLRHFQVGRGKRVISALHFHGLCQQLPGFAIVAAKHGCETGIVKNGGLIGCRSAFYRAVIFSLHGHCQPKIIAGGDQVRFPLKRRDKIQYGQVRLFL